MAVQELAESLPETWVTKCPMLEVIIDDKLPPEAAVGERQESLDSQIHRHYVVEAAVAREDWHRAPLVNACTDGAAEWMTGDGNESPKSAVPREGNVPRHLAALRETANEQSRRAAFKLSSLTAQDPMEAASLPLHVFDIDVVLFLWPAERVIVEPRPAVAAQGCKREDDLNRTRVKAGPA